MNVIFHFLFNYLFINALFGNAQDYMFIIFIASVFIDVTHLPYLLKVREGVVKKRFGSESRTRFHELYGLILCSAFLCVSVFFLDLVLVEIASMCILLHFAIDFASGRSVPFYPYSKKEVFLHLFPYGYRNKILFEIGATALTGVMFWLTTPNLVL